MKKNKNKKQVWYEGWHNKIPMRFFDKKPIPKNKKGKPYLILPWKTSDASKLLKKYFDVSIDCHCVKGNYINGWFFIDDDGKDFLYEVEYNEFTKYAINETNYILFRDLNMDYDIPFFKYYRYILKLKSHIDPKPQQPVFEKYTFFTHKNCKFLIRNKNGSITFDNGLKESKPIQLNDNKDGVVVAFDYNGKIYNETFMFEDMSNFQ